MRGRTNRTPEKRGAFLAALAETASVTKACEISKVSRRSAYDWRDSDPKFAAVWNVAAERGTDVLEDEAVRRAHDGVDEPVFYQGDVCGHIRRYSDTLLMFTLKARRPERFRDRTEITGANGGPIETKEVGDRELARRVAFLLTQGAGE